MRRPRPKFKVSFYFYFCCFWINVAQINFENINRKIQRIISDSRFQLKLWFNVDARAPSIPLLNFPFNIFPTKKVVLSSTSALSTKLVTKQQFWENTCQQRFCFVDIIMYYLKKGSIYLKKQNIDKIALQKGLTVCESALSSLCSSMLDAQPATVYPASPDDPSHNSKLDFGRNVTAFIFLTIVLSTIVAVGMNFDPTCRQRNLSWMMALQKKWTSDSVSFANFSNLLRISKQNNSQGF